MTQSAPPPPSRRAAGAAGAVSAAAAGGEWKGISTCGDVRSRKARRVVAARASAGRARGASDASRRSGELERLADMELSRRALVRICRPRRALSFAARTMAAESGVASSAARGAGVAGLTSESRRRRSLVVRRRRAMRLFRLAAPRPGSSTSARSAPPAMALWFCERRTQCGGERRAGCGPSRGRRSRRSAAASLRCRASLRMGRAAAAPRRTTTSASSARMRRLCATMTARSSAGVASLDSSGGEDGAAIAGGGMLLPSPRPGSGRVLRRGVRSCRLPQRALEGGGDSEPGLQPWPGGRGAGPPVSSAPLTSFARFAPRSPLLLEMGRAGVLKSAARY